MYKRECYTSHSSHLATKDSCIMFENRVITGECFETSRPGGSSSSSKNVAETSPAKRSRLLITLAPPTSPEDEESCMSSVYDSTHNLETGTSGGFPLSLSLSRSHDYLRLIAITTINSLRLSQYSPYMHLFVFVASSSSLIILALARSSHYYDFIDRSGLNNNNSRPSLYRITPKFLSKLPEIPRSNHDVTGCCSVGSFPIASRTQIKRRSRLNMLELVAVAVKTKINCTRRRRQFTP